IQATWPGADLAAWRTFVRFFNRAAARNAGVLAVRDRADCICGVLAYRLDHDLQAGPVLAVQLFTAVDLMNSPRTVQALLAAGAATGKPKAKIREQGKAQLRTKSEQLEEFTHALGLAPAMVRALDGRILLWGRGLQALYGWSAEKAVGRISHELLATEFPVAL